MIEREDGAYFGILLHQIIDAHREAERNRKLWARIWMILSATIGLFLLGAQWSLLTS